MAKIAFLGAGSTVFARNLLQDLFTFPDLYDSTIALMDIDPARLADTEAVANLLAQDVGAHPTIEATTDLRRALDGADYEMSLSFRQLLPADPGPTPIRAILTGRVPAGGKTYYPPVLPCTADLSSVPVITLPRTATFARPSLSGNLVPCDGERYTIFQFAGACDLDNDFDVDRSDIDLVMAMRNRSADPGDPRDLTGDGRIDVNDARRCTLQCNRPRCAS